MAFEKSNGTWKTASLREKGLRKKHGLQGPIDDAFLEPFLVVRPTGTPWNAAANDQALRILQRFDRQYALAYRGHIRVKDDKDVTPADFAKYQRGAVRRPGQQSLDRKTQRQAAAALDKRHGRDGQPAVSRHLSRCPR